MKNKQYLRYVARGKCGVVASSWSNMALLRTEGAPLCAVGACEDVVIWNLKQAEKVGGVVLKGCKEFKVLNNFKF